MASCRSRNEDQVTQWKKNQQALEMLSLLMIARFVAVMVMSLITRGFAITAAGRGMSRSNKIS